MPRKPRKNVKASFFHILVQGINKNYIFEKEKDILYYIKLIYEESQKYNIKIIAYCVMNNHTHILVNSSNSENLSSFMHKINTKYAIYYNKKYNRVGYVFRNRFKSEEIYDEKHLYTCINYIHNNPVKAKICNGAKEYKFSSYKEMKRKYKTDQDEYVFLEDKEDIDKHCKNIIKNYLEKNQLTLSDLMIKKENLKELVMKLRFKKNVSFRKIERSLNISRETLRKLVK